MEELGERPPPGQGRGLVLVDAFCRGTGLDRGCVGELISSGAVEAAFDDDGEVIGLFDDALPSLEHLRDMGLPVATDYRPDQLESRTVESGPPSGPDDESSPTPSPSPSQS